MKCNVETDSGGMIYMPDFMKFCTGIQNLIGWVVRIHSTQTAI
jgi:hypothetical protein